MFYARWTLFVAVMILGVVQASIAPVDAQSAPVKPLVKIAQGEEETWDYVEFEVTVEYYEEVTEQYEDMNDVCKEVDFEQSFLESYDELWLEFDAACDKDPVANCLSEQNIEAFYLETVESTFYLEWAASHNLNAADWLEDAIAVHYWYQAHEMMEEIDHCQDAWDDDPKANSVQLELCIKFEAFFSAELVDLDDDEESWILSINVTLDVLDDKCDEDDEEFDCDAVELAELTLLFQGLNDVTGSQEFDAAELQSFLENWDEMEALLDGNPDCDELYETNYAALYIKIDDVEICVEWFETKKLDIHAWVQTGLRILTCYEAWIWDQAIDAVRTELKETKKALNSMKKGMDKDDLKSMLAELDEELAMCDKIDSLLMEAVPGPTEAEAKLIKQNAAELEALCEKCED